MTELVINDHAVDKYAERILNEDRENVGSVLERSIRKWIREAYEEPDFIYNEKQHMPPIHIKNDVAVIADSTRGDMGVIEVPTVYHREFVDKDERKATKV